MSTFLGQSNSEKLTDISQILDYFKNAAKAPEDFQVGLEAEFFAVDKTTGQALPYEGTPGISCILNSLAVNFGYEKIEDLGKVIALRKNNSLITLEPGGQVELSAPPVKTIADIEAQLKAFLDELKTACGSVGSFDWIATGIQPYSSLEDIAWVPKVRYGVMRDYLEHRGKLSHHMMKRTATNQVCFDYSSPENAMESMRIVLLLTSIVSTLFAHSGFSEGQDKGYQTERIEIWNHTDSDRTGLMLDLMQPHKKLEDYVEYLLNIPMLFLVRDNQWIQPEGLCFSDYLKKGYKDCEPTFEDFELHLSSVFPEVRLKTYIEIRGADAQCPHLIPGLAAFWKGILYDEQARAEILNLLGNIPAEELLQKHKRVPKEGWSLSWAGMGFKDLANRILTISEEGLARQSGASEVVYLQRIRKRILDSNQSLADSFREWYQEDGGRSPQEVVDYFSIFTCCS